MKIEYILTATAHIGSGNKPECFVDAFRKLYILQHRIRRLDFGATCARDGKGDEVRSEAG